MFIINLRMTFASFFLKFFDFFKIFFSPFCTFFVLLKGDISPEKPVIGENEPGKQDTEKPLN
jgi:hypothetical protein